MKRPLWIPVILFGCFSLFPQQVTEESVVINIEVPVRVFEGGRFIDDLTIKDFEVFEDGRPQKIEAVYLVKKTSIERSDESRRFAPNTERTSTCSSRSTNTIPGWGKPWIISSAMK